MDIVFMGTAEFACPSLEAIATAPGHRVRAVVTQPDRPSGRELKLTPPPVKQAALRLQLPVLQPERIKEPSVIDAIGKLRPELIVVVAYGQMVPKEILQMPRHGCINVHGSLLPRHRGASPIQAALLHGDTETGVTTMFLDERLDAGEIILQDRTPIAPSDNTQIVHDRLAEMGAALLLKTLELLARGNAPRRKQDESSATVCKKLRKEDGRIDWNLPAREIWNRIRALNPWPGAYCHLQTQRGRKLVKIWNAEVSPGQSPKPGTITRLDKTGILVATGQESLLIKELQLEGGRRLNASDFITGHDVRPGTSCE